MIWHSGSMGPGKAFNFENCFPDNSLQTMSIAWWWCVVCHPEPRKIFKELIFTVLLRYVQEPCLGPMSMPKHQTWPHNISPRLGPYWTFIEKHIICPWTWGLKTTATTYCWVQYEHSCQKFAQNHLCRFQNSYKRFKLSRRVKQLATLLYRML